MEDLLPWDGSCVKRQLSNGLTLYVKVNGEPRQECVLKCVVNVGSVMESERERGVAHFIEHLAFRGAKGSSGEFDDVRRLENAGVKFGVHQNAFTSYDETVFELTLPLDSDSDSDIIAVGLGVLRRLALEVRLSQEDVDKERSIVLEEWRASRSVGTRADERYWRTLFDGTLYAERLPIGLVGVIRSVTSAEVRGFYEKFYGPSRMAIIAVGDFDDAEAIAGSIESVFGQVPARPTLAFEFPKSVKPGNAAPRVVVVNDVEATSCSVTVDTLSVSADIVTVGDYRTKLAGDLFHSCLNRRLSKLSLSHGKRPPFVAASAHEDFLTRHLCSAHLAVYPDTSAEILSSLKAALNEVVRIREHGISADELSTVKSEMLSQLRTQWKERDQTSSDDIAMEFLGNFLRREPVPGVAKEVAIATSLVELITPSEVVAAAGERHRCDADCCVVVNIAASERRGSIWSRLFSRRTSDPPPAVGAEEVRDVLRAVVEGASELQPWDDAATHDDSPSIQLTPPPTALLPVPSWCPETESALVTLSNGVRVAWRETDYFDDELQFQAFSWGGLSQLCGGDDPAASPSQPPAFFMSAAHASVIAEEMGRFDIEPAQMMDLLAGKNLRISTDIEPYRCVVSGDTSTATPDFTLLLALLRKLFLTEKIKCDSERMSWIRDLLDERIRLLENDPQHVFAQRCRDLNSQNHFFFKDTTAKDLEDFDPEGALDYFCRSFSTPPNFWAFSGAMPLSEALPLLEAYLGKGSSPPSFAGTPAATRRDVVPLRIEFPREQIRERLDLALVDGDAQQAWTNMTWPICIAATTSTGGVAAVHESRLRESVLLDYLTQVLERRLMEELRFERGGVYSVSVSTNFETAPPLPCEDREATIEGALSVRFTCERSQLPALSSAAEEVLADLCTKGPSPKEIAVAVKSERHARKAAKRTNSFWTAHFCAAVMSPRFAGDVFATFLQGERTRDAVRESLLEEGSGAELLLGAFRRFLPERSRLTQVSLRARKRSAGQHAALFLGVALAVATCTAIILRRRK